jgi:hypothetical protein
MIARKMNGPQFISINMKAKDIWRAVNTWAIYIAIVFVVSTLLFGPAKGATAVFFGTIVLYGLGVIVARLISWLSKLPHWVYR